MIAELFFSFLLVLAKSQDLGIDGESIFEMILQNPTIKPSPSIWNMSHNDVIAVIVIALACMFCAFLCTVLAVYMCKQYTNLKQLFEFILPQLIFPNWFQFLQSSHGFHIKVLLFSSGRGPTASSHRLGWRSGKINEESWSSFPTGENVNFVTCLWYYWFVC